MTPLIFPYTFYDNPVLKKVENRIKDFSIISIHKDLSRNLWNGIYKDIISPDDNVLKRIESIYMEYMEKIKIGFSIESVMDLFKQDEPESTSSILKEINGDPVNELSDSGDISLSGFFLFLCDQYEKGKMEIVKDISLIDEREKEIFKTLLGEGSFKAGTQQITNKDFGLPDNLKKKRLLAWLDLFFYLGQESLLWLTDDMDYLNILSDAGIEFEKKEELPLFGDSEPDYELYESAKGMGNFLRKTGFLNFHFKEHPEPESLKVKLVIFNT